jgi:SNF2 family DNA or RNA helicase
MNEGDSREEFRYRGLPTSLLLISATPFGHSPTEMLPWWDMIIDISNQVWTYMTQMGENIHPEVRSRREKLRWENVCRISKRLKDAETEGDNRKAIQLGEEWGRLFSTICIRRSNTTKMPGKDTPIVNIPPPNIRSVICPSTPEQRTIVNDECEQIKKSLVASLKRANQSTNAKKKANKGDEAAKNAIAAHHVARILPTFPGLGPIVNQFAEKQYRFTQANAKEHGWFDYQVPRQNTGQANLENDFLASVYPHITHQSPKLKALRKIFGELETTRVGEVQRDVAPDKMSKMMVTTDIDFNIVILSMFLQYEFPELEYLQYGGWMTDTERRLTLEKFTNAKATDSMYEVLKHPQDRSAILLSTSKKIGTGIDGLIVADQLVEIELLYNPKTVRQVRGRLVRIGQRKEVVIHEMCMEGSEIEEILLSKEKYNQMIMKATHEAEQGN